MAGALGNRGDSADVDGHRIWAAKSGALKVIWLVRSCRLESHGKDAGEDLVFGQWPEPVIAVLWRDILLQASR